MASLNEDGNITARCIGCEGALTAYLWADPRGNEHGCVTTFDRRPVPGRLFLTEDVSIEWRLFRCSSCGVGALAAIEIADMRVGFPEGAASLVIFAQEAAESLPLPKSVPPEIEAEFREAERCAAVGCYRASAALFRSVLDKVMRMHGYKANRNVSLQQQIDLACDDGILTASRKRRAHEEIRVLGNDVLHDEWRELNWDDCEPAHRYSQRILEDFYDDRESVVAQLLAKGRLDPPTDGAS